MRSLNEIQTVNVNIEPTMTGRGLLSVSENKEENSLENIFCQCSRFVIISALVFLITLAVVIVVAIIFRNI